MGNTRSQSSQAQASKADKRYTPSGKNETENVTSHDDIAKKNGLNASTIETKYLLSTHEPDGSQAEKGCYIKKDGKLLDGKDVKISGDKSNGIKIWKSVSDHLCLRNNGEKKISEDSKVVIKSGEGSLAENINSMNRDDSREVIADGTTSNDASEAMLREAISKLREGQGEDWFVLLGQISKIVRTWDSHRDIAGILTKDGFVNKLEKFLDMHHVNSFENLKLDEHSATKVWPVIKRFLIIFWITCDKNITFCQYLLGSKVFLFLISELRILSSESYESNEMFLFIIKSILGILHNISRHMPTSKWNLRNEGLVTILRTFLPSEIPMVRLKALMVLSYILSESENEIINSDDDNFEFILKVLTDALNSPNHKSSKFGMSAAEVLKSINNLAINDENKIRIVRNGALPLYQDILDSGLPDEIKITIMTLWSLAFHHYNKQKMRDMPGIMGKLYELRQCDDDEICHAARGTFWELENTSKSALGKSFSSSAEKDPNQPHIMISYQWDSQPIMLKVKDRLKHAGYKVWMDVEHMSGSTLEAMALAVEKAAVVLICMSERYKNSPNCRTEAEYVYRLRKDFVPLRLQQEYVPDGWLGILAGTRLYFDIYSEEVLDAQLPKLIKELNDRGKICSSADVADYGTLAPRRMMSRDAFPVLEHPVGTEVVNWACEDVLDWLTTMGIAEVTEKFQDIDGQLLLELQKIQKTAPEFFYTTLRTDYLFSTIMILKFSRALRCLR